MQGWQQVLHQVTPTTTGTTAGTRFNQWPHRVHQNWSRLRRPAAPRSGLLQTNCIWLRTMSSQQMAVITSSLAPRHRPATFRGEMSQNSFPLWFVEPEPCRLSFRDWWWAGESFRSAPHDVWRGRSVRPEASLQEPSVSQTRRKKSVLSDGRGGRGAADSTSLYLWCWQTVWLADAQAGCEVTTTPHGWIQVYRPWSIIKIRIHESWEEVEL